MIKTLNIKNIEYIKPLFIIGFLLQIIAQVAFSFTDKINLLKPIDFIHWTILLGIVLIIPGVLRFSNGFFSKIGAPITIAGIISFIGMCTIDFVLWSFNSNLIARNEMYYQLVAQPFIWNVFITMGPPLLFIGLSIQSLDYLKTNLTGVIITNIGSIITAIGGLLLPQEYHYIMTVGYLIFAIGLICLFPRVKPISLNTKKLYNVLFLFGILLEVVGQIFLANGMEFVYSLRPIDFAHWALLLGVSFMLPKIVNFPKSLLTFIATPIAVTGVICIIGMCVLDFIWWNMPNQEMRNELAGHLSQFPTIWEPFISKGPSFLNIGILLLSLNYIRQNKLGVILVLIATLFIFGIIPTPSKMIFGYFTTLVGFGVLFLKKIQANEYKD